ncbi:LmeA family phospholipid-binding protein [Auraticoccus monumenti]|uniref:DUF2993 domain-containing protein n=1 Tax=Auraticoccus monumenti TaxID=675864 RepID=A0A1G7E0J6_9ACTN|nr:DUF2993 domain-containing protein [Auraticoccus monumenti]SDE57184.1 Protein of unknown function [Auraticoccus monumenti]
MTDPTGTTGTTVTPGRGGGRSSRVPYRTVVEVVAVVLGLVGLLWGADALARAGAESLIARNVQDATGVAESPEVEVHGAFFLPQVIRGAYSSVDVTARGVTNGPLRLERVQSHLVDVRVPFRDVLLQDVRRIGIGRAEGQVTLTYADVNSYLERTGRPLTLTPLEDGELRLAGEVDLLTQQVDVSAVVRLSAAEGGLRVSPVAIQGGQGLDEVSRLLLGERLGFTVPLDTLPFGLGLTEVSPGPDGVLVDVRGSRIVLGP